MNRDELRAIQGPLKQEYRETPASALITLHAEGELGAGVTCSVRTGQALVQAGLALAACAGVTLRSVATSLELQVSGIVRAEGDLDFRGTLGVDKETPVGFTDIRLTFELDTDADEEQIATLLRLTERYCVVFQTLHTPPTLTASVTTSA